MITPIVFVVDDEPAVLEAVTRLLRSADYQTRSFSSPQAFLEQHDAAQPGCLVLDVSMPNLSGLRVQEQLTASGVTRPIIFISGRSDLSTGVRAMKAGAVDMLTKPFDDDALLDAVGKALERDASERATHAERRSIERRLALLTAREREVLTHVVAGKLNKHIAADLGTVEKTVKVHRGRVMQKMGATSIAELVRIADRGGVKPAAVSCRQLIRPYWRGAAAE